MNAWPVRLPTLRLLLLAAGLATAQKPPQRALDLVLVTGAPGTAEYAQRFDRQVQAWQKAGAQAGAFVLLQGVELGPGAQQDRHREEGAGDLGEVQPLLVLPAAVGGLGLGGGYSTAHGAAGAHRRASFAGTTKTTAAGKRCERGSR